MLEFFGLPDGFDIPSEPSSRSKNLGDGAGYKD
jgi:hypothetical protein